MQSTQPEHAVHEAAAIIADSEELEAKKQYEERQTGEHKLTYEQVLKEIFQWNNKRKVSPEIVKGGAYKQNLDNMRALAKALGDPQDSFKIVHIAGTNGKGSVCLKTASALQEAGFKVGLYTSPHISCFRERIQVDREMISEQEVLDFFDQVTSCYNTLREMNETAHFNITFFEVTTMIAFLKFKKARCDFVVLEVGVGGTLDATNIVNPYISVITQLGFDHTESLGETIEKIAKHKGGIIKKERPVVVSFDAPHDVLKPMADAVGAPYIEASMPRGHSFVEKNNALATKAVQQVLLMQDDEGKRIDRSVQLRALETIQTSNQLCRMQLVDLTTSSEFKNRTELKTAFIDVCHNISGLEAVITELKLKFPDHRIRVVCAFSKMKDIDRMMRFLLSNTYKIHFAASPHFKLESISNLYSRAKDVALQFKRECQGSQQCGHGRFVPIHADGDLSETLDHVITQECASDEVLLVCGSFYIMETVMTFFYKDQILPTDPKSVNQ